MSNVLKSQRKESKTDFLEDINNAFVESCKRIEKLPKKLMVIKSKMYDLIFEAHTLIYEGNSIYPTNQHEVQIRRDRLILAKAKLYAFKRTISAVKEIIDINTSSAAFWSGLIQQSIESLSKIIQANKKQYKDLKD